MSYNVDLPVRMFTDNSGKPLEGGYIFVGVSGQNPETNPQNVFWDAALTIPAAQPIRTIAGKPARNGSPAPIYTSLNYSLTVKDSKKRLVFSVGDTSGIPFISSFMINVLAAANAAAVCAAIGAQPVSGSTFNNSMYVVPTASFPHVADLTTYYNVDTANSGFFSFGVDSASNQARLTAGKTGGGTYQPIAIWAGGAERMRVDTYGNIGIGVAPNAGWSGATQRAIEMAGGSSLSVIPDGNYVLLSQNLYHDGTSFKAISTGGASQLAMNKLGFTMVAYDTPTIGASPVALRRVVFDVGGLYINTSGKIGYGIGAGSSVTQLTSKLTGVTINAASGQIILNNSAMAAGYTASFNFNNTQLDAGDVILLTFGDVGGTVTVSDYNVWSRVFQSGGTAVIYIKNIGSASRSEAVVLNYVIIKGSST